MKNFIFKSTAADLQKMFQLLETIQKNGLYCTYRIDSILKNFEKLLVDKSLQKQVDEYFEDGAGSYPGLEDSRNDIPEKEDND